MSICCDCGKDKQVFLCLSCNDKWLDQAEKRGHVEELHFLQYTIEADIKDNKVWKEGSQYFEIILDKIERRLLELEKGEIVNG